jgi:hypothetical protein
LIGTPYLIRKTLLLGAADPALYRVFVQALKELFRRRCQVQGVKVVRTARWQGRFFIRAPRRRPEVHVAVSMAITFRTQPIEVFEKADFVREWLTMIRKGKRYQACSGDPTGDPAEHETIT